MMRINFGLVLLFSLADIARGACPNKCNGHGECSGNTCQCYSEYDGGNADCSARVCPKGTAWVDKAYADGLAHRLAECSNRGSCDKGTGQCECFPGFTGIACQRLTCPNSCSGHGFCTTTSQIAIEYGPDYDHSVSNFGDGVGIAYEQWDKDSTTACVCDDGYSGADCGIFLCGKGDDPLTFNQANRKIRLKVIDDLNNYPTGRISILFQGKSVVLDLNNPSTCSEQLSTGPFGTVACTHSQVPGYNLERIQQFDIEFLKWPSRPKYNNLYWHDGNPKITEFFCDTTYIQKVGSHRCIFEDLVNTNVREYAICSNRGTCNYRTGECVCIDGFTGVGCNEASNVYFQNTNSEPVLEVNAQGHDYTSSVLMLNAYRSESTDFNFIDCSTSSKGSYEGKSVFKVRGDGVVTIDKLQTQTGGLVVQGSGLVVKDGGATITENGVNIYSSSTSAPALGITAGSRDSLPSEYTALLIASQSDTTDHYLMRLKNRGNDVFSVKSDGYGSINGGVQVTNGVTIESGGLDIYAGGATVRTGQVVIARHGLSLTGGITVQQGGARIDADGLRI